MGVSEGRVVCVSDKMHDSLVSNRLRAEALGMPRLWLLVSVCVPIFACRARHSRPGGHPQVFSLQILSNRPMKKSNEGP